MWRQKPDIDLFFYFIFFFKGKCYFALSPRRLLPNICKTLPFRVLQLRENTNKTKTRREGFIGPEQNTVSVVWGWPSSPLLSLSPQQHPKEWTINTSLWTANKNRIHTMHIFINSCPFKNSSLMSRPSLVTVWVIVGDVLRPLVFPPPPGPNIIAQEVIRNAWLRELALVRTWSTVGRHGGVRQRSLIHKKKINKERWKNRPSSVSLSWLFASVVNILT